MVLSQPDKNEFLDEKSTYQNNSLVGERKHFYPNGEIRKLSNYKNNKLDGKFIEYYPNGSIRSVGQMKNDEMDGKWVFWYFNGQKNVKLFVRMDNF